jgi:regulator of RNase E activity RraA
LYREIPVPDISDAVGRLYTLDGTIRPLYRPMRRIVGIALTVKAPPGDNWAIYGALGKARQDDVLMVDWMGYRDGCGSGVNGLLPAIDAGLAGVIVDGGWRDIGDLQTIDFPVHGRCISPFSPSKCELGEINVPVSCGGVIVEPGDVVVADGEGAVVVPRRHAEEVARFLRSSPGGVHAQNGADGGSKESESKKITDAYLRSLEDHGDLQDTE